MSRDIPWQVQMQRGGSEVASRKGRVSVVIPFYNSSGTLDRALRSIEAQTVAPCEVIVVDDASEEEEHDRALVICASFEGCRLMTLMKNSGPGVARNVGWDAAMGDWIAFLDSDDAWHPRKLEQQLSCADQSPNVVLVAGLRAQYDSMGSLREQPLQGSPVVEIPRSRILISNPVPTSSAMVQRDISLRFPARRYCEDYELWLLIVGRGYRAVRIENPVAGRFKDAYGEAGLSASVWRMIAGEWQALWGAFNAGGIRVHELMIGLSFACARTLVRTLMLIGRRCGVAVSGRRAGSSGSRRGRISQ